MTRLVARTSAGNPADDGPAGTGPDVTAFSSPRRSMWGHGTAIRIDLPAPWPEQVSRVAEVLSSLPTEGTGPLGSGPVAFGSLPYDRCAPASLVVPEVVCGQTSDGERWTTVTSAEPLAAPDATITLAAFAVEPPSVTVASVRGIDAWILAVRTATKRIARGELTKVVLARELTATTNDPWVPGELYRRFRAGAPHALCFCVDDHVGATPELLVSRVGDVVRAQPMAGTLPRTGDPETDQRRAGELLGSHKFRIEHRITIDMVHDTLLGWCSYLDAEPVPSVVAAGPVQHLATLVEGRLSHPAPSVLDLVAALHPTPAVGGWPRDIALEVQADLEDADRGRYGGPVGWVDAAGNGVWGVGIRGVQLDGTSARWFAGVGVVADSDPEAELEETRSKIQAVLVPLIRL